MAKGFMLLPAAVEGDGAMSVSANETRNSWESMNDCVDRLGPSRACGMRQGSNAASCMQKLERLGDCKTIRRGMA